MPQIENKEKVLYWLRRREKALAATATVDHEAMAQQGRSYGQRAAAVEQAAKAAELSRAELDSLREAINFIAEHG